MRTAGSAAYPPQTEQQVEIHRVTWQALDSFPTDVLIGATSFRGDPVIPDILHECQGTLNMIQILDCNVILFLQKTTLGFQVLMDLGV